MVSDLHRAACSDARACSLFACGTQWTGTITSVGAGIDSFYEYLLKSHVVFNNTVQYGTFLQAYSGIVQHVLDPHVEMFYRNVDMIDHTLYTAWVDSLSAYMAGLQVLLGDVQRAVRSHMLYWKIWQKYSSLPERWDFTTQEAAIPFYILRPELIESTYFLYQVCGLYIACH